MSKGIFAITHEDLVTLLRGAVAFRGVLDDARCGDPECNNCKSNTTIIEELTPVVDKLAGALGIDVQFHPIDGGPPHVAEITVRNIVKH